MVHSTRKNAGINVPVPFKPAQFVNVNLEDKQREELKAIQWTHEQFDSAFNALCNDGYSLKLRYDARNDCFSAWLLAPDGHKNSGRILSGRGSTPMKAVKQLVFIHFKILEGEWGVDQGQVGTPIDD